MAARVEIDRSGLVRLTERLERITTAIDEPSLIPLLDSFGDLVLEDNRAAVLAGRDKKGNPAPPLQYRRTTSAQPLPSGLPDVYRIPGVGTFPLFKNASRSQDPTAFKRGTPTAFELQKGKKGKDRGPAPFKLRPTRSRLFGTVLEPQPLGVAPASRTSLPNNNLTTEQYRTLTGPRLAPRFEASRSIANLRKLAPLRDGDEWLVDAVWVDVLTPTGSPLLPQHFDPLRYGRRNLPRYDLRGITPEAKAELRALVRAWAVWIIRGGVGAPPRANP